MNLYLISHARDGEYDVYDSAVVAAPDEATARTIHPRTGTIYPCDKWNEWGDWIYPDNVEVKLIGKAARGTQQSVICASFNAG
jgi:hypothetical protein